MKIFITGASGTIGSAVAAAFARAGHDTCGLVRTPAKAAGLAAREIEPVVGSMEEPKSYLDRARHCDVLVHCAAEYSARYMDLDQRTTLELTEVATRAEAPRVFLYTSGVWVYGDSGDASVDETTPLRPPAIAKRRVEHERVVLQQSNALLRTLVIRPGCVYGESGSLTADWFESATASGAARVVDEGTNRWAMVHVHDLAELYVRAAESKHDREIFNAVDQSRSTQIECARAASYAAGASGRVNHMSMPQSQAAFGTMAECLAFDQVVDSTKAARLLGWHPRHHGFVSGAQRYFRAWKALQAR